MMRAATHLRAAPGQELQYLAQPPVCARSLHNGFIIPQAMPVRAPEPGAQSRRHLRAERSERAGPFVLAWARFQSGPVPPDCLSPSRQQQRPCNSSSPGTNLPCKRTLCCFAILARAPPEEEGRRRPRNTQLLKPPTPTPTTNPNARPLGDRQPTSERAHTDGFATKGPRKLVAHLVRFPSCFTFCPSAGRQGGG